MVRFEVHHFLCLAAVPFAWLLFPLLGCCSLWLAAVPFGWRSMPGLLLCFFQFHRANVSRSEGHLLR